MQPHPPQLPTDEPKSPAPKKLKNGALLLLLVAIIAMLVAVMLPKKQADANRMPTPAPQGTPQAQQAQTGAYKTPTQ